MTFVGQFLALAKGSFLAYHVLTTRCAMRRAVPVRVSVHRDSAQALDVVEDAGPDLPSDLAALLQQQRSPRTPPIRCVGGGIGGLGLAIVQRVAQLHVGSLPPLLAQPGGTRLCLTLPLAVQPEVGPRATRRWLGRPGGGRPTRPGLRFSHVGGRRLCYGGLSNRNTKCRHQ
jgi:hypothetical protein